MIYKKLILIISLLFILNSCSDAEIPVVNSNVQSGVILSFDDDYVDEWYTVNSILEPYNWKATFFVSKFNQLSSDKILKLKELKNYGHEIGGHGLNHLNAVSFISANGTDAYLNQEINPMINAMNENNLSLNSFAYPFGSRNTTTDAILLNKFQILRGTTYGVSAPELKNCYYNNSNIVYGLGLDKSYAHFSISYFLSLLEYAKNNNKIVIFYAHKTVQTANANYQTEYQTLIEICNYVKNNNMKFYKMSDLHSFNSSN